MRTLSSWLLACVCASTMLLVSPCESLAVSFSVGAPELPPGQTDIIPGGTVTIPLTFTSPGSYQSIDFAIQYDASKLTLSDSDVRSGPLASGWFVFPNTTSLAGVANISMFSLNLPSFDTWSGILAYLDFHVLNTASSGYTPITLRGIVGTPDDPTSYAAPRLDEIQMSPGEYTSGSINISAVPEPSTIALLVAGGLCASGGIGLTLFRRKRAAAAKGRVDAEQDEVDEPYFETY